MKAAYGLLNTLAAAVVIAAFIVPAVTGSRVPNELDRPGWVLIGFALHLLGQGIVWRFWRRRTEACR